MDELERAKSMILAQQFIIQHLSEKVKKEKEARKCAVDANGELVEYMSGEGYVLCNNCGVWVNEEDDEDAFSVYCSLCEDYHTYCNYDICGEENWCPIHDVCKPHPIDFCYPANHLLICECFTPEEIQTDIEASGRHICDDCMGRLFENSDGVSESDE